jgi:hypothetical protein
MDRLAVFVFHLPRSLHRCIRERLGTL